MGRVGVVTDPGADTGDLVGGDTSPHPASADQHSSVRLAFADGQRHRFGEIGIIHGGVTVGPEVDDLVPQLLEPVHHLVLQFDSGVVRSKGDAHAGTLLKPGKEPPFYTFLPGGARGGPASSPGVVGLHGWVRLGGKTILRVLVARARRGYDVAWRFTGALPGLKLMEGSQQ